MNSLTNEEMKKILDGAPDGATHWCANDGDNGEYVKQNAAGAFFNFYADGWDREYHDERFTPTNSLSDLAEILALRERVEQGGWISVDERLPEYGVPVLVFVPEIDAEESYITTDLMDKDYDYWLLVSDNYNHAQAVGRVTDNDIIPTGIAPYTHWQPLPLPPKENTNDN